MPWDDPIDPSTDPSPKTSIGAAPSAVPCPCTKITSIKILSVRFTSDYEELRDFDQNWDNRGFVFPKPDWTPARANPVVHKMGKPVSLRLTIDVKPPNACPETGTIRGAGPGGIVFETQCSFKPGKQDIPLACNTGPEMKIQELKFEISWTTTGTSIPILPASTANTMFVVMGEPSEPWDNGVTVKRMRHAVETAGSANSLDPHTIVRHVMSKWTRFNLNVRYLNPWKLGDGERDEDGDLIGADCQTIVRYAAAVIKTVGCPGKAEVVVIWAKPSTPEHPEENALYGPDLNKPPIIHPSQPWVAALVDGNGRGNAFEACLKFTDEAGERFYYAGGVGRKDTDKDVLHIFTGIGWFRVTDEGRTIEMARIYTYRKK
jgi:hypothetical protein